MAATMRALPDARFCRAKPESPKLGKGGRDLAVSGTVRIPPRPRGVAQSCARQAKRSASIEIGCGRFRHAIVDRNRLLPISICH
jgi:hypothetical protein